jgi:RNA polymerase sigma-70 factor (ECF subfamily)
VAAPILRSQEAAEDAAQETLARVLGSGLARTDLDSPDAWLASIARREALRIKQRDRERRWLSTVAQEVDGPAAVDLDLEWLEGRMALDAITAGLTPDDRYLIRLKYDEDLTLRAIANRLGILEGNAKVRLHRALEKLRDES